MKNPSIAILGTGYVGLVAAAVFADRGFQVITSSQDEEKVKQINQGKAPFYEEGLDPLVRKLLAERFRSLDGWVAPAKAVAGSARFADVEGLYDVVVI